MSAETVVGANPPTLDAAIEFIWTEADLLDSKCYLDWLDLWCEEGIYVIPIDPATEDFEGSLNYLYDDAEMRKARVIRLLNNFSISATSAPPTIRTVSRFRLMETEGARLRVRCAQHLVECKRGLERLYAADLTYDLVWDAGALKIQRKLVRLINASDALAGIAYLL